MQLTGPKKHCNKTFYAFESNRKVLGFCSLFKDTSCIFFFPQSKLTDIFIGPSDSHFVWKKNGQRMKACITEQSHMLFDGRLHVLSWVNDAVSENTKYECSFISKVGNTASEVLITAEDKGRLVLNVCCVCPDPNL